jgi:tetratricopeptide (TPR) repeat protein
MLKNTKIFILCFVSILSSNGLIAQSKGDAYLNKISAITMINQNSEERPDIYAKSITYLSDCLKYFPSDHEAYFYRGVAKMSLNKNSEAITDFTKAIQLNSISPFINAYYNRAICKIEVKQYKEALKDLEMVKKWDPYTKDGIYTFFGKCNFYLGNVDEAKKNVDQAIKAYPNVNDNYFIRGLIKLRENDKVGACEDFTKAKQLGFKKNIEAEIKAACN